MKYITKSKNIFEILFLLICFYVLLIIFQVEFNFNLPLLRYVIIISSTYILIVKITNLSNFMMLIRSNVVLILSLLIFIFILRSLILGLPELINPDKNYIRLKQFIGEKMLLFAFPFLLFIKPRLEYWIYFLKYSFLILVLTLPLLVKEIPSFVSKVRSPEMIIRATAGTSGFFLLLTPYFTPFKKRIILLIYLISITFMLYHARRNMVLYFGSFMLFYVAFLFMAKTIIIKKNRVKQVINFFLFIFFSALVYFVLVPDFSLFAERVSTGIESRESVFEDFFEDLDVNSFDFLYGRGMFGSFYSRYLAIDESSLTGLGSGQRDGIENGYLQLILNYGFIYVCCFFLISVYCFFKGVFFSNNLIVKASGTLILVNLVDMIGFGIPEVSLRYFLVWFSMPFCLSSEFRSYSDKEVLEAIKFS